MTKHSEIQEIYKRLQVFRIKLLCCKSCILNVYHKDLIIKILHATETTLLRYQSIAYAYGIYLQEVSVWKTYALYAIGYSYRFNTPESTKNLIVNELIEIKNSIEVKIKTSKFQRMKTMLENFLIEILKYNQQMQAL